MGEASESVFQAALKAIDAVIRGGEIARAQDLLKQALAKEPSRESLAQIALLLMRCGLPHDGVKLLTKIVRGTGKQRAEPSTEEKIAYGTCLIRVGAVYEGMRLLDIIDPDAHPEVLHYLYFGLATQWAYADGIELLERYLRSPGLAIYSRRVAQANLAAALVYERRHQEATLLLDELEEASRDSSVTFLRAMVGDLIACNYLLQNRLSDAERFLNQSESIHKDSPSLEAFFHRKWKAVLALAKKPSEQSALAQIAAVRDEALQRNHWETVRDCDRYQALYRRDKARLQKVLFGTPFSSFRERVVTDFGEPLEVPATFDWHLKQGDSERTKVDLLTRHPDSLGVPTLIWKTVWTLARDFYRPMRVTQLYSELYPDEFYNPESSPHRVHEIVNRTRKWFLENQMKLTIDEEQGSYRLGATEPVSLVKPLEMPSTPKKSSFDFALTVGKESFTSREFSFRTGMPLRSAQRLLEKAVTDHELIIEGEGRGRRYRVPQS